MDINALKAWTLHQHIPLMYEKVSLTRYVKQIKVLLLHRFWFFISLCIGAVS